MTWEKWALLAILALLQVMGLTHQASASERVYAFLVLTSMGALVVYA